MREGAFGTEPTASENLVRALVGIMTATIVLFAYQHVVNPGALPDEHDPTFWLTGGVIGLASSLIARLF